MLPTHVGDLALLAKVEELRAGSPGTSICIAIHFYYAEPIEAVLQRLPAIDEPFDLIVTVVAGSPADEEAAGLSAKLLATRALGVRLVRVPNLGDDTLPFLALVFGGHLGPYTHICKLHGKVTKRHPGLGSAWLGMMLDDLLPHAAGEPRARAPWRLLSADVPLVGPAQLLVTHPHLWSDNFETARALLARLGVTLPPGQPPLFFAGTAFWIHSRLIEKLGPLRDHRLNDNDFVYGADGKFGHGFERALPLLPVLSGQAVGDTRGLLYRNGTYPVGAVPSLLAKVFRVPTYVPPAAATLPSSASMRAPDPPSRTRLRLVRLLECATFVLKHRDTVKSLELFDPRFYAEAAGTRAARLFPLTHYLLRGRLRRLPPIPACDSMALAVTSLGRTPLETYMEFGRYFGQEFKSHALVASPTPPPVRWPEGPAREDAVVVHAFHLAEYEILLDAIAQAGVPFDLIVTTPHDADQIRAMANARGLGITLLHQTPNHGRDVFPFVQLLNAGLADRYQRIVKLHTKRSPHRGDGYRWFLESVQSLIGPKQFRAAQERLGNEPRLGLLSPPDRIGTTECLEANWWRLVALSAFLGHRITRTDVVFPAGTMFWARGAALKPIAKLGLGVQDFEIEAGQLDGTMAHALERLFGVVCRKEGFEIDELRA